MSSLCWTFCTCRVSLLVAMDSSQKKNNKFAISWPSLISINAKNSSVGHCRCVEQVLSSKLLGCRSEPTINDWKISLWTCWVFPQICLIWAMHESVCSCDNLSIKLEYTWMDISSDVLRRSSQWGNIRLHQQPHCCLHQWMDMHAIKCFYKPSKLAGLNPIATLPNHLLMFLGLICLPILTSPTVHGPTPV